MSMVDRDEMLDLLDELRAQLPVEIKRAQELLAAREKSWTMQSGMWTG